MATALRILTAMIVAAAMTSDTYVNPVLHADYSDPDVIRVGSDFYLISSSFNAVPGIPILHSRDLVNWSIVGHALPRLVPEDAFVTPQHGGGVWAPAIRYHDGSFWIYYPDPDRGIYLTTAAVPSGPWSTPRLVKAGKGLIDPCPLWDDDRRVYLVHAWARSRAGFANVITLMGLSGDGTRPLGEERTIIDGNALPGYTTLEGPKLYKRDGWYYVFAPAGGVKQGWQSVFRSRTIDGPYEGRIVLAQGTTEVNGPHQGALVDTPNGDWWFLHFQDREAYGRVVHLEPVVWRDGWPVIGDDSDGDGKGEPVRGFHTPIVSSAASIPGPQTSDEFGKGTPGLQWQWQANPDPAWIAPGAREGMLRLAARALPAINLWSAPNLLLQKLPAPAFVATAAMTFAPASGNERAGLIVFGTDYAWIGLRRSNGEQQVVTATATAAADGTAEREVAAAPFRGRTIYLRATVRPGAVVDFSYSADNRSFAPFGGPFTAKPGRWVGAKIGLFAASPPGTRHPGFAEFDWVRID